ncbi:MAG: nickel-dependent hydrogenase large subunit [Magnetococcales bacterium]|nr:nickel-dependent hydrogenase large subunit [Magnetococcales bacterium]
MEPLTDDQAPPSPEPPPRLSDWLGAATPLVPGTPWPRHVLGEARWLDLRHHLFLSTWTLVDLWAEEKTVHVALLDDPAPEAGSPTTAILSLECPEGRYPSLARARVGAIRLERAIRDLSGLEADGAEDRRPWLNHGRFPLASKPPDADSDPDAPEAPYRFFAAEGEGVHQLSLGPVFGGVEASSQFLFHANGETVVRLEHRGGYLHRGIEGLMRGRTLREAATLAGRISGDSAVAYALAFAQAAERAVGVEAPPRGVWLRAVMAEMERIANHLGDLGAMLGEAGSALLQSHAAVLRERIARVAHRCFSHRLMMDRVVPGGVAADLHPDEMSLLQGMIREVRPHFEEIVSAYGRSASLLDRTLSTGVVTPALASLLGAGGVVGRSSGRAFDARVTPGYPPYDHVPMTVPPRDEGDVHTRLKIRALEIRASLNGLVLLLDNLPGGATRVELPPLAGEGAALVEGFRGEVWLWLRVDGGQVIACRARDPSWFHLPLLEQAVKETIVADFPLLLKSFNPSHAGCDL